MNADILDIMNKAGSMIATDRLVHNGKLSGGAKVMEGLVAVVTDLETQKNNVYLERNRLVAVLSKLFPSCIGKHDGDCEPGWENIIYVSVPTPDGKLTQVSWHIHESDLPMFAHLSVDKYVTWDGHSTEEKYKRLAEVPYDRSKIADMIF